MDPKAIPFRPAQAADYKYPEVALGNTSFTGDSREQSHSNMTTPSPTGTSFIWKEESPDTSTSDIVPPSHQDADQVPKSSGPQASHNSSAQEARTKDLYYLDTLRDLICKQDVDKKEFDTAFRIDPRVCKVSQRDLRAWLETLVQKVESAKMAKMDELIDAMKDKHMGYWDDVVGLYAVDYNNRFRYGYGDDEESRYGTGYRDVREFNLDLLKTPQYRFRVAFAADEAFYEPEATNRGSWVAPRLPDDAGTMHNELMPRVYFALRPSLLPEQESDYTFIALQLGRLAYTCDTPSKNGPPTWIETKIPVALRADQNNGFKPYGFYVLNPSLIKDVSKEYIDWTPGTHNIKDAVAPDKLLAELGIMDKAFARLDAKQSEKEKANVDERLTAIRLVWIPKTGAMVKYREGL